MFICSLTDSMKSPFTIAGAPVVARPRAAHAVRHMLALMLLLGLPLAAQSPGLTKGQIESRGYNAADSEGSVDTRMEAKRVATLNANRQRSMKSDADKLLELARELNDDALAGGTTMSAAERMHKAAEIEKLAKNVKDKMTYAIGAPSEVTGVSIEAWPR